MMKNHKILFLNALVMSSLIAISAQSWLGIWMGLEINLLSMIPLMNNQKNMLSTEASIKYFITQAIASTVLLFAIIIMSNKSNNCLITSMMINSSMLTKMGAAPFHFWFPEVMEGLQWMNCLLLLTWQKMAPMMILSYSMINLKFLIIIAITSMLISGMMGINQTSMRKIMAFSSINHIGWMISSIIVSEMIWMYYFIIYSVISLNLIVLFNVFKIYHFKQMILFANNNKPLKMLIMTNFLSIAGLPPFLGFMPKWFTIQILVEANMITLAMTMVILTLVPLYFYTRITLASLALNSTQNNSLIKNQTKLNTAIILNIITLMSLLLCTSLFNNM
uniref:NADH-ubiquinone oxidoreductase chain 2 n=1 Tax=Histeroidea sp. 4 KM-2017 TaxID=2219437 RepID=A0A346RHT4_9COLE|nr:NADH dehydrogenase subunit 2 [Histeroidea sp. 4 KM-2017]